MTITPSQLLHATDKSTITLGSWDDHPAVIKRLAGDEPYWRHRMAHERRVYASLDTAPFTTPRLLHADADTLILTALPGSVAHTGRYPGALPEATIMAVVETLQAMHAWTPPASMPALDHVDRLAYQLATCQITTDDAIMIRRVLARTSDTTRFEHGDPLTSNFLLHQGKVAVVDFEHAGLSLPGADWAMMRLLWAPANPWLRPVIDDLVEQEAITAPYAVALMSLACREAHLHRTWPATPEQLAMMDTHVGEARQLLHDVAGGRS